MQQLVDNHDLIMANVPTLDEIPESTEDQMPAETCICQHRDLFQYHDEHTPGVGCERRHCPCTWWITDGEEI